MSVPAELSVFGHPSSLTGEAGVSHTAPVADASSRPTTWPAALIPRATPVVEPAGNAYTVGADQLPSYRQTTGRCAPVLPFFAIAVSHPATSRAPVASRAAADAFALACPALIGRVTATYVDVVPCRIHAVGMKEPSRPSTIVPSGSRAHAWPSPKLSVPNAASATQAVEPPL